MRNRPGEMRGLTDPYQVQAHCAVENRLLKDILREVLDVSSGEPVFGTVWQEKLVAARPAVEGREGRRSYSGVGRPSRVSEICCVSQRSVLRYMFVFRAVTPSRI